MYENGAGQIPTNQNINHRITLMNRIITCRWQMKFV
jgi:hypothetical protein